MHQALLPQLDYASEGLVAKLANPGDGAAFSLAAPPPPPPPTQ